MAAEASKSSSSADTYLGSLISLTSKSEIRYEGVLYCINPEESSIGLRNVRSFGSEGRKKDGPQIPPSDKVYEFILFRGTDIKDLQVKSSPPAQTTSSVDNDPAIIQSHYPQPSAPPTSLPAAVSVSPTDVNSSAPQMRHPGANIPGGIPIYQPGASLGPWGPSPPAPTVNGNPLPMPMYWPGMYVPPNGLPHLHQQTLLQQPSGLSVPQQPMQFSGFSAPPPNVPNSNFNLHTTSSGPNFLSFNPSPPVGPLNVSSATSPFVATSSSSAVPTANSILPLNLPAVPLVISASEPPSSSVIHKGSNTILPSTALNVNLPAPVPLPISNSETSSVNPPPPVPRKVNAAPSSSLPYPSLSQPTTSIVGSSSSTEVPIPSLVTPDQLLPSGQSKTSSELSKTAHKDIEAVQVSSSLKQSDPVLKEKESRPPILPLPSAPRIHNKSNGGHHPHHNYRGGVRGRGTGQGSRPVTRFTEDFDFTAMNEKFNKDEVWGELGKKAKEGDEHADDNYEDEGGVELPNIEVKSVYNKDDFFDSLSSNTVNNTSHNGRPRFSEQLKLDTETFGESARYRGGGGRGSRGFGRGGRASSNGNGRGGYGYGRGGGGYGSYATGRGRGRERGRGRPLSSQAS